ncbi:MAG: nucleotide-binding domain containing protein, partial [Raoultibacter sp.]
GAFSHLLVDPLDVRRNSAYDAEEIWSKLQLGQNVLVETARTTDEVRLLSQAVATNGLSTSEAGERIVSAIADVIYDVMERGYRGTLFVIGGDTLNAILHKLHIHRVYPLRELATGIVLSCTSNGSILLSKSGNFGSPQSVATILSEMSINYRR